MKNDDFLNIISNGLSENILDDITSSLILGNFYLWKELNAELVEDLFDEILNGLLEEIYVEIDGEDMNDEYLLN
jgi:hypothetical protein